MLRHLPPPARELFREALDNLRVPRSDVVLVEGVRPMVVELVLRQAGLAPAPLLGGRGAYSSGLDVVLRPTRSPPSRFSSAPASTFQGVDSPSNVQSEAGSTSGREGVPWIPALPIRSTRRTTPGGWAASPPQPATSRPTAIAAFGTCIAQTLALRRLPTVVLVMAASGVPFCFWFSRRPEAA